METSSEIVVATYNVLADAYVRPEFYPQCDPRAFASGTRYPRVIDRVLGLDADVICLQEVDASLFDALDERLTDAGYRGRWAKKSGGKPDGCATFVRAPWALTAMYVLAYADGGGRAGNSGHVALFTIVNRRRFRLTVANTHLKWDAPETPETQRIGLAQARELAGFLAGLAGPRVLCGDFNAELGGPILDALVGIGLSDAHPPSDATNNADGVARKIDFVLHSAPLAATPRPTPPIDGRTPLPSDAEPSDHVPLVTELSFGA